MSLESILFVALGYVFVVGYILLRKLLGSADDWTRNEDGSYDLKICEYCGRYDCGCGARDYYH